MSSHLCIITTVLLTIGPVLAQERGDEPRSDASDLTRARLTLDQIQPVVTVEDRSNDVKPLSARGAKQLERGKELERQQRFTEGALELERGLRYDPNHPALNSALAQLHWRAGNPQRASAHALSAIEKNPSNALAQYILGKVALTRGDRLEAIQRFRMALASRDFDRAADVAALTMYDLGIALAAEGYATAAINQLARFESLAAGLEERADLSGPVALIPGYRREAVLRRADLLEQLNRFGEAAELLAELVERDPADADLAIRFAELLLRSGSKERALEVVRGIESNAPKVIALLADVHEQLGNPEAIIDDLQQRLAADPDDLQLTMRLAEAYARLGRSEQARNVLGEVLARRPEATEVRRTLIDLLADARDWQAVFAACAEGVRNMPARAGLWRDALLDSVPAGPARDELVAQLEPDDYAQHYLHGVLLEATDRGDEALAAFRRSHELQADFVPARVALAEGHLDRFEWQQAIKVAARGGHAAVESAELERILGDAIAALDDTQNAELHYKAAIQLDRTNTRAMFALAEHYLNQSDGRNRAKRELRALLDVDPGHAAARELLILIYRSERNTDEAHRQLEEARQHVGDSLAVARAEALLTETDREGYRKHLLEAMERFEPDARTWLAVAESYDLATEAAQAREAFEKALELDPRNERSLLGIASADHWLIEWERAAATLETLARRFPNRRPIHELLIETYWNLHEFDKAIGFAQDLAERKDIDDQSRRAYRGLWLESLSLAGRDDEVLSLADRWASNEDERELWTRVLATQYEAMGKAAKALSILEERLDGDPDDRLRDDLIRLHVQLGQCDVAFQLILDQLYIDPENDGTLSLMIDTLKQCRQFDEALELIQNRIPRTLNATFYRVMEIQVLDEADRHGECLDRLEQLVESQLEMHARNRRPMELEVDGLRVQMALQLIELERFHEAEKRLNEWINEGPPAGAVGYLNALAYCYRQQGREERATEVLTRALEIAPRNTGLNNDVAYGWIDRGVRIDEAEPMTRIALADAPRQVAYLDTYGWLRYKQGRFDEARTWLTRAAQSRGGDDPIILDHLGDACWRTGARDEALRHWERAATLVADSDDESPIADLQRVMNEIGGKIDAARSGGQPGIAPIAEVQDSTKTGEAEVE